ncbi:hypothetical protein CC78DRAFT_583638 [Lojkania enalia]|uniref:Uncharacterized protein n=1 Tax=Lojkania enalia TaxID=147567 RepID=A0A9P4K3Q2_9PLEO|nr:hypothetical protein CC78DRAFT_583638 [Didymosphaeria enalia]
MAPQLMSPRLPGVNVLPAETTGPQYRRWRRGVENAFKAKEIWGHCDGSIPMPMPASGPNFFSPVASANPQPQLLEERKAWVKSDRDVKLDIFLSVSDEIKLEIFEVGPPLPPSAMTAQEMLEALDERFMNFKFEDYHHIFCHFLNLHIDQFSSLEEFNSEFLATLEDLLDHGFPLDNVHACSAYFSKLRCTQNPWVAKKLKEWDSLPEPPLLQNLMKECPPWMIIRPLATKTINSETSAPPSYTEELVGPSSQGNSSASEGESDPEKDDDAITVSSESSKEQEITVHASVEDLTEAFPKLKAELKPTSIPPRLSSKPSMSKMSLPPLIDRPLPPLPTDQTPPKRVLASSRSRSVSPNPRPTVPRLETPIPPSVPRPRTPTPKSPNIRPTTPVVIPQTSKTASPVLTPQTSRTASPVLTPQTNKTASPVLPQTSKNNTLAALAPPSTPPTASLPPRPSSSRGPSTTPLASASIDSFSSWPQVRESPLRTYSSSSSQISLPLQGAKIPIPEFQEVDLTKIHHARENSSGSVTGYLSASPPRSITSYGGHSRQSSFEDDDEKKKKRTWSIKARLSHKRLEVKEII